MEDEAPSYTFLKVGDDSYSVLIHLYGEKNNLVNVLPCPVIGFLLGARGPEHVVTLRGTTPIHTVPIWGPEGCVHMGRDIYPDLDTYIAWAKKGLQ